MLAVESDAGIGALCGKFDGGDVLHPHKTAVLGFDDHALELIEIRQVGVGRYVGDDKKALGLARCSLKVIGSDRRGNVAG